MPTKVVVAVLVAVLVLAAVTALALWLTRDRPSRGVAVECTSHADARHAIREHLMRAIAAETRGFLVVDEKRSQRFVQFAITPDTSIDLDRPAAGLTRDEWLRCVRFAESHEGSVQTVHDDELTIVLECGLDAAYAAQRAVELISEPLAVALPWRLAFESGAWE